MAVRGGESVSELVVMLGGEAGTIPAVQVAKMIDATSGLIRSVAGGEGCEPVIVGLSIGSARAVLEAPEAACRVIASGLQFLQSSQSAQGGSSAAPEGRSGKSLDAVKSLARLTGGEGGQPGSVLETGGSQTRVTPEIGKRAAAIKPISSVSLTDVCGVLYAYSHKSPDEPCRLKLRRENLPVVDIALPADLAGTAAGLLEKPVSVYGMAVRNADGHVVKMDATRIEPSDTEYAGEPVSASELIGLWEDADTHLDSVQLVRQMRDAW